MAETLTVREAAERFGVSKDTIRRRIKSGELQAVPIDTAQGFEWRILLGGDGAADLGSTAAQPDSEAAQLGSDDAQVRSTTAEVGSGGTQGHPSQDERLDKALDLVEKLQGDYATIHKENLELAARCGYLQARLEAAERQVLALSPPMEPERPKAPWWKRMLGLEPA